MREAALEKHAVLMDWGTILFQGLTLSGKRPEPGSDLVPVQSKSEPDFEPPLPVRSTTRESVREKPEKGPSSEIEFELNAKGKITQHASFDDVAAIARDCQF